MLCILSFFPILIGILLYLIVVLTYSSLMDNDIEHLKVFIVYV